MEDQLDVIDLTTLFSGDDVTSEPMFVPGEYEDFVRRYREQVIPQLEEQAEDRRRSEEESRLRLIR